VSKTIEVKPHATTADKIVVGAAIAGKWSWPAAPRAGSPSGEVTLTLYYQNGGLAGSVTGPGRMAGSGNDLVLTNLSFKDDRLSFSLERILQGYRIVNRFSGRLDGDVISGTVDVQGRNGQSVRRAWEARRAK
jgi:hypothetical protein